MASYDSKPTEKSDFKGTTEHFEDIDAGKIENVETIHDELTELSAIESTAASKAAWLISITVSLGGLLFGTLDFRHRFQLHDN